ncbi:lysozyme inhibitor LprI family protein [Microvirga pudoricolor]|uniref:lysozyme inhibitor LprI family protein n=1 Tax=Microvirga pudoricolor TaxID=2778729 RepID=UPI00194DD7CA|nr:lysozyme inhibitor LprI family protein [Microvirga pudoricolor]MBM6593388.1 lysozyme inhibitor LprI family protein [Microvirga pudoricolor]
MDRLSLAALILVATVSAASAQDCAKSADQMTLNQCADASYRRADAELNRLYRQIEGRLKGEPDSAKALVGAQRAWIAFRDAECTFSSSAVSGGSIYPTIYSGCLESLTRKRVDDLKRYLNCQDGDMSCPVPAQ